MSSPVSIVEYFSENSGSSCGYCKGKTSSFSHGLWGHVLTCSDYQDMIDRGWRRSGKYCYKPTMNKTCCPQYPIRCKVEEFVPRKSHKKVMRRFRNYIINDTRANRKKSPCNLPPLSAAKLRVSEYESDSDESNNSDANDADGNHQMQLDNQKADEAEKNLKMNQAENTDPKQSLVDNGEIFVDNPALQIDKQTASNCKQGGTEDVIDGTPSKNIKPGKGADPSKPPARKAKDIRRERALLKKQLKGDGEKAKSNNNVKKSNNENSLLLLDNLTDIASFPENSKHKLEIRMVKAQTSNSDFMETFQESFQVYRKYQVTVHKDKPDKCTATQFTRFLCDSSMAEVDGCTTGINISSDENSFLPTGLGAYHQQYLIDGKIVCVGVLDILPHCVSSVYFYYDPEYSFLSLGTLSSLFEISYVRKLTSLWRPELLYYYMGFYIHSCPKMRYKSQYCPSFLLCPETYEWHDVNKCNSKLDKSKYSRFNEDMSMKAINSQLPTDADLNSVLVLHNREAMPYGRFVDAKKRGQGTRIFGGAGESDKDEVSEYAMLTGMTLARKMLLYRS